MKRRKFLRSLGTVAAVIAAPVAVLAGSKPVKTGFVPVDQYKTTPWPAEFGRYESISMHPATLGKLRSMVRDLKDNAITGDPVVFAHPDLLDDIKALPGFTPVEHYAWKHKGMPPAHEYGRFEDITIYRSARTCGVSKQVAEQLHRARHA